ncbi:HTH domain-containing protein [Desulfonatronospira sp.]|uniref:HTH domain-containing protein n=1 Tax=Desulfonatronospira sp. TaxID=1962951 RepID=UPI0025C55CD0|nr:HTH domain-containing protein [Desulfonatronospira sp.]
MLSQPGGSTINRMSEALDIDRRSVYRLLDIIQALGFPVYDDIQEMGRSKTMENGCRLCIETSQHHSARCPAQPF